MTNGLILPHTLRKAGNGFAPLGQSPKLWGAPLDASGAMTHAVGVATMAHAGQAVASNARTVSAAGTATLAYAGQAVASNARRVSAVGAATLGYAGQAVLSNARRVTAVAAAVKSYAGQAIGSIMAGGGGGGAVRRALRYGQRWGF